MTPAIISAVKVCIAVVLAGAMLRASYWYGERHAWDDWQHAVVIGSDFISVPHADTGSWYIHDCDFSGGKIKSGPARNCTLELRAQTGERK